LKKLVVVLMELSAAFFVFAKLAIETTFLFNNTTIAFCSQHYYSEEQFRESKRGYLHFILFVNLAIETTFFISNIIKAR